MQKQVKYRLLFLVLAFIQVQLVIGQGFEMDGRVMDDHKEGIEGVKVVVNNGKPVYSDKQGYFTVILSSEKEEIKTVEATKRGFDPKTGRKQWWIPEGDSHFLLIELKSTPAFTGKVVDDKGEPVARVGVRLTGDIEFPEVYTGSDGYFKVDLPASMKVSEKTNFLINNVKVNDKDKDLDTHAEYVKLVYHRPIEIDTTPKEDTAKVLNTSDSGKTGNKEGDEEAVKNIDDSKDVYDVLLMDGTEQPLGYSDITIDGENYRSDATGYFKLHGPIPARRKFMPIDGQEIVQLDVDPKAKTIHIQVQGTLTSSVDTLQSGEVAEEYKEEMNRIIKGLQQERLVLTAKAIELRRQIARLANRLGTEQNLKPKEREELGNTLLRLEQTLEQNNEAYERAQAKTREAIDKLKSVLDSAEKEKREISEKARRERVILLLLLLGVAMVAFAFYVIGRKVKKQKEELEVMKEQLEDKVQQIKDKNDKILAQSDSLKAMNHTITSKNQKITDSIFYAKTIQEAILPTKTVMDHALSDYFVLYEPKDIVSGDFYWFSEVKTGEASKKIVAAVDCTGHGVPGGFMSMIGNTLLNEIVNQKNITDTGQVLDYLNNGIKKVLRQEEKLNADGMSVCLCAFEETKKGIKVEFTGARRPLFYLTGENSEVGYLKGNPQAIGGMKQKTQLYKQQEIVLKKGDVIYLTSDGLMAQGDSSIGKIGTNGFKRFILDNAEKSFPDQKEALQGLLKEYQSKEAQRDDILVFAIRL